MYYWVHIAIHREERMDVEDMYTLIFEFHQLFEIPAIILNEKLLFFE
jgi:hypothetical protein